MENYPRKAFEQKDKEAGLEFNPGLALIWALSAGILTHSLM